MARSGSCRRGKKCKFSHDADALAQVSSKPCIQYRNKGKCSYGDKCIQSHEVEVKLTGCLAFFRDKCTRGDRCGFAHDKSLMTKGGIIAACMTVMLGKECERGDQCIYDHSPEAVAAAKGKLCKRMKNGGNCDRSDCPYNHDKSSMVAGAKVKKQVEKKRREKTASPCFAFFRNRCEAGETCGLSHEGERPPSMNTVCADMIRTTECSRGVHCKFSHDADQIAAQKKLVCHRLLSTGKCESKKCHFSHDPHLVEAEKAKGCRGLRFVGKCSRRETCIYSHDSEVIAAMPQEPCPTLRKKGKCKRGASCLYSHGDEGSAPPKRKREEEEEEEEAAPPKKKVKTNASSKWWEETISGALKKHGDDAGMKVKALRKKVIKAYRKSHSEDATDKAALKSSFAEELSRVKTIKVDGKMASFC